MIDSLEKKIISWNSRFPVDRWWRHKYNVPFNSKIHRESNFIDQLFEYREEKLFEKFHENEKYVRNAGDWLKAQYKSEVEKTESLIEEARREFRDLPESFE